MAFIATILVGPQASADAVLDALDSHGQAYDEWARTQLKPGRAPQAAQERIKIAQQNLDELKKKEHARATSPETYSSTASSPSSETSKKTGEVNRLPAAPVQAHEPVSSGKESVNVDGSAIPKMLRFKGSRTAP